MNSKIKSVCVYLGASPDVDPTFKQATQNLGKALADEGVCLVYGGGGVGLMGELCRSVIKHGGDVIGIIPDHLYELEQGSFETTELHVVDNMHERKHMMFERSDALIAMPGGVGTLDELIEVITWKQLGLHDKPILVVNHENYWAPFLTLIQHVIDHKFASVETGELFAVVASVDQVIPKLEELGPIDGEEKPHKVTALAE